MSTQPIDNKGPAARPCGSCPYRRDAPSGLWDAAEYARLPDYDKPTHEQPASMFGCHQQDGHLCAGWVGTHDMGNNLSLRIAAACEHMSSEEIERTLNYEAPVPLFGSGREAADHGMKDLQRPDARARRTADRLTRKLTDGATR